MKRNNRNFSWIFVTFLLAVIVILLIIATFRQIISNYYLEEHNIELHSNTGSINTMENDQHDYIYENIKLRTKIQELQKELELKNRKLDELEESNKADSRMNSYVVDIYESLIQAELLQEQGNLLTAAETIKENVNKDYLLRDGSLLESKLRNEVFFSGAIHYYNEGYSSFKEGKYADAIYAFNKSIYFQNNDYFSDDTLYLLGYSYYYTNKIDNAIRTFEELCNKYPESGYTGEVKEFIKTIK